MKRMDMLLFFLFVFVISASSVLAQDRDGWFFNYRLHHNSRNNSRTSQTGKLLPFSRVVLDQSAISEIPDKFQVDSLEVVGRFRVFDRDFGWTSNRSWLATNRQNREVERNLEKFDVRYGRKNLIVFCIGLVDRHNYLTGEPDDGPRGKTLGPRRGHDGVHSVKRLWGYGYPAFYAGYKFYQNQRGTEYIVCRRPTLLTKARVALKPPVESIVALRPPKRFGLYPFIEVTHNEWYQGTSLAVNDQRIGVGYASQFGTEWFTFDAQFSPLNYRRVADYFELEDVHQYSASSIKVQGNLDFWWLNFFGSEYFVHDLEHSSWDENSLIGAGTLNLWRLRLTGIGQTSFVNYIADLRQSQGRFNQVRARVGFVPFDDPNSDLELGWQMTKAKFSDDFWERVYQPRVGGVYLKFDYDANLNGIKVKFWTDFAYEKVNEIILEKLTNQVVDPPKNHYALTVGASLFW